MENIEKISTGNKGLDSVINYLRRGDNVVWQTDSIQDYMAVADDFVRESISTGRSVVYVRFAAHERVIADRDGVKIYELDAGAGFEKFTLGLHEIIEREGKGVFYVFDCLSELLEHWATDLMIGNFFYVTCPYLFELDTVAYFAILQNSHSFVTIARIRETTQLLLDLNKIEEDIYIHPLKVWNRYSPAMFLPHVQKGETMVPVTNSSETSRLFGKIPGSKLGNAKGRLDYWDRLFLSAKESAENDHELRKSYFESILRFVAGCDDKIIELARNNLVLDDLLALKSRLIGSGSIGGKATGMIIARKILNNEDGQYWQGKLEAHDSFYLGSDVFYSYIVQNDWWKSYLEHKKKDRFIESAEILRNRLRTGKFPDDIKEDLVKMLEYFGQSPVIVRSSSLLEDGFGNSFSGKYESFFCVNQGSPADRYRQLETAIKEIYASTLNEDALTYRKRRGLDERDEQMAVLIQRVSGDYHGKYFFPLLAGVGFSKNTYMWRPDMDAGSGMIRLVTGLGTRAVNRTEGDYPRIMALDRPGIQPLHGRDDIKKYSQHFLDVLDLEKNRFETISLNRLMWEKPGIDMDLLGVPDHETNERIERYGIKGQEAWILTYENLIEKSDFVGDMQRLMKTLETAYGYPVDIEFTVNFLEDGSYRINLLQCRPLQTKGIRKRVEFPVISDKGSVFFDIMGNFMGGNVSCDIKKVIYIAADKYAKLPETRKYGAARLIGRLVRMSGGRDEEPLMLIGPGRWGTTTASLGIPISFSEISNIAVLCEIAFEIGGMAPELSFGSHFFQDLVEEDIFYAAVFPKEKDSYFNEKYITDRENILLKLIPEAGEYADIVKVAETRDLHIVSDILSQRVLCYSGR